VKRPGIKSVTKKGIVHAVSRSIFMPGNKVKKRLEEIVCSEVSLSKIGDFNSGS
jgi:hypothetical protein